MKDQDTTPEIESSPSDAHQSSLSPDEATNLVTVRLTSALGDTEAGRALTEVAIDYLLDLPLDRYLDLELLISTAREAYQPQALKDLMTRALPQALERWRDYTDATPMTPLEAWLTPELDAELRAFVMRARLLSPERVQRWAHHPLTRHVTRAFVEETLERFIQKVKPSGEGGGVIGAASRGALGWAQRASRGVLNGVADQLQSQLKALTSDFISASMTPLLDQLAVIVNTPEAAQLFADAQLKGYTQLMGQSLPDLITALHQELPAWDEAQIAEWSELGAEWVEHLIALPEVTEWVTEIQAQLILDLGDKSLKELVGGEEPTRALRQALVDTLSPHLSEIAASRAFQNWCQRSL